MWMNRTGSGVTFKAERVLEHEVVLQKYNFIFLTEVQEMHDGVHYRKYKCEVSNDLVDVGDVVQGQKPAAAQIPELCD